MNTMIVEKLKKVLDGEIRVPSDKSLSHRAVMFAAVARGTSHIGNFLEGEDCLSTLEVLRGLGVEIQGPRAGEVIIVGSGGRLIAPTRELDCGNSGTTMRLMSGILAAQGFPSQLVGDSSLSQRPMRRVVEPLAQMGASIHCAGEKFSPPLLIRGGNLVGIDYRLPIASAQVKSAILLAGLFAQGRTRVVEPSASRDHTERLLQLFGGRVERKRLANDPRAWEVSIEGGQSLDAVDFQVPGDISSAAFWLVAAAAMPGSHLRISAVGLNSTRTAVCDILRRMGADICTTIETNADSEPAGTIEVRGTKLHGTHIGGEEISNAIDEIPALAIAAALAQGETVVTDAAELRVKETDRIAAIASNLRAMGTRVNEQPTGMIIEGGSPLYGCELPSFGDHRIAMAFAIAGLFAEGRTVITDSDCVAISYPGFERELDTWTKITPSLAYI